MIIVDAHLDLSYNVNRGRDVRRPAAEQPVADREVATVGLPGALTEKGRGIVRAMDELRMIHDLSHLAEESFWQLLEMSDGPVIASHSNCRAIVPGDRQLSDEMIKAVAQRNGVIGINFYDE